MDEIHRLASITYRIDGNFYTVQTFECTAQHILIVWLALYVNRAAQQLIMNIPEVQLSSAAFTRLFSPFLGKRVWCTRLSKSAWSLQKKEVFLLGIDHTLYHFLAGHSTL